MKALNLFFVLFIANLFSLAGFAQNPEPIQLSFEEISIAGAPALQSFVGTEYNGKWILLGGRTDGLHDHRPPFSFPANMANDQIWMVDPNTADVYSASVNSLPDNIQNQCLSTNIEFERIGNHLIMLGGYGVDINTNTHTTHPVITRVDLAALSSAMENNQPITSAFESITDNRFAVTGGYLGLIDDTLYQVGGQNFVGRYNPMGGPSFTQVYNEKIQKFTLSDPSQPLAIDSYEEWNDPNLLHRRDYNMKPHISTDGNQGLTAFTGVFRPNIDLPWFNTVDISSNGYQENPNFEQKLNHYHSASVALHDAQANTMRTYFFGGIAMYYYDNNVLIEDSLVPFVKTVSVVTRDQNGQMTEDFITDLDSYIGAGAEFLHANNLPEYSNGVIQLNPLPESGTVLGYIYGGIESTDPNIFMQATGSSVATNRIIKVTLSKSPLNVNNQFSKTKTPFVKLYPNPGQGNVTVRFASTDLAVVNMSVHSLNGQLIDQWVQTFSPGSKTFELNTASLSAGNYLFTLSTGDYKKTIQFVITK